LVQIQLHVNPNDAGYRNNFELLLVSDSASLLPPWLAIAVMATPR